MNEKLSRLDHFQMMNHDSSASEANCNSAGEERGGLSDGEHLGHVPWGMQYDGAIVSVREGDSGWHPILARLPFLRRETGLEDGNHDLGEKGGPVYGGGLRFIASALGHGYVTREKRVGWAN